MEYDVLEGNALLEKFDSITAAARDSDDGTRCCVAPHPDLQDRLASALEQARKGADPSIQAGLTLRGPRRVGLNDGLIVHGADLPLGTPSSVAQSYALERSPLTGNVRVIVVLVDFSDVKITQNKKHFQDLFFSTGVLPHGSVAEYYTEVSGGKVSIVGEVAGPFTLPHPISYYAHGASGLGSAQPNARTMAQDAAVAANPSVNFAPYDNDGNGYVDAFVVIHAGKGAEVTGSVNDIWSHKWVLPSVYAADGTKVYAYLTVPEDSRIGVCAHELGHLLFGFPDLYDTDYSSSGVGNWCLMGGGSWNGNGDIPAHPSAWCKCQQGWVSAIVQTTNATVTIPDIKTGKQTWKLWKDGAPSSEYFLVENRQRSGFDAALPGDGLLIWHIDETIGGNSDEHHPKVALEQADGADHLGKGTNRGDAGDPFPGSSNNTTFTSATNPNSHSYAGADSIVSVTQVSASGPVMTARFGVKAGVVKPVLKDKTVTIDKKLTLDKTVKIDKNLVADKKIDKSILTDKKAEKPVTDKAVSYDKPGYGEGGGWEKPGGELYGDIAGLQVRVAQLEAALGVVEPFIPTELRPEVGVPDEDDTIHHMAHGNPAAKRQHDTKPRES